MAGKAGDWVRKFAAPLKVKPWRPKGLPLPGAALASLSLLLISLVPLVHQAMVLGMAVFLQAAASSLLIKQALMGAGMDPVYASVFNRTLGNIEARGLAVAGPLGDTLHQLAPGIFASPDRVVPGALATALVGDGVSVLASAIATLGTELIFIFAGLALLRLGLRRGRAGGAGKPRLSEAACPDSRPFPGPASAKTLYLALAITGLMLQARGVIGLVRLRFSLEEIEIMGLSHVFTKLFPVDAGSYREMVAEPFASFVPYVIPSIIMLAVYGVPLAVLLLRTRLKGGLRTIVRQIPLHPVHWPLHLPEQRFRHTALLSMALLGSVALSQALLPALADYNYPVEAESGTVQVAETPLQTPEPPPAVEAPAPAVPEPKQVPKAIVKLGPTRVEVAGANNVYGYTVEGQPERIRGVGYNVEYMHLPPADRAARYERDFGLMRGAGVNTILGWQTEQFDELTLEKAQEYGIGVIMPYHLVGEGDYASPAYQEQVERDVTAWVQRFQKHPAVRMWGIGNEVVHSMGKNPLTPRSRAFARFYVKLADKVRALDPDHPVTYRDAEDLYLPPLRDELRKDGVPRPWLVYGVNFFTMRMCDSLQTWPKRDFDTSVMVSEFAPSGLSPDDRPKGYVKMLKCIAKQNSANVLGGFAYVWTTTGPEAIDRVMGLVNDDGQPVDRSLSTLGKAYRHNLETGGEAFAAVD